MILDDEYPVKHSCEVDSDIVKNRISTENRNACSEIWIQRNNVSSPQEFTMTRFCCIYYSYHQVALKLLTLVNDEATVSQSTNTIC